MNSSSNRSYEHVCLTPCDNPNCECECHDGEHLFVQGYEHHVAKPIDVCWATVKGAPCLRPKADSIHYMGTEG